MRIESSWIRIALLALFVLTIAATGSAVAGECLSIGTECGCPIGWYCG